MKKFALLTFALSVVLGFYAKDYNKLMQFKFFLLSRIRELENFPFVPKDENYGKGLTRQADFPEILVNSSQKKNSLIL